MKNTNWNGEMTDRLIDLISRGYSHRDCAEILHISKNAVIGKCNRLGLQYLGRTKGTAAMLNLRNFELKRGRLIPKKYLIKDQRKITFEQGEEPESLNKTLLNLEDNDCRYPQEKIDGKQVFCGHPTVMASSYCKHHFHVCFNIPEKRKQPTPTEIIEEIKNAEAAI